MSFISSHTLLSLIASIASALGILIAPLWWCTPLGLALFIFILWEQTHTTAQSILYGCIFGFCTAGAGLLSLWEISPPENTALSTTLAIGFLWLIPTLALGALSVVFAYIVFTSRKNLFAPCIALCAFILHEYARMWAWMLVTYGKGASTEPHLSITALGYALADNSYLLQVAAFGGLFALTVLLAVLAIALACIPRSTYSQTARIQTASALFVVGIVLILPLLHAEPKKQVSGTRMVAVFSTNVSATSTVFNSEALIKKIVSAPAPDIILLPEGKTLETVFSQSEQKTFLPSWFETGDVLTIRSTESLENNTTRYNTIVYESSRTGLLAKQHKIFLMPEGEYVPYLSKPFLSWFKDSKIKSIPEQKTITHGNALVAVPFAGAVFGTLLCSEVFSPFLYHQLATNHGATVLVNLADPQWFQGSHLLFNKTVQIAKVHAVQNRSYFIAAQNSAPSFVINPQGQLLAQTAWGETDILFFSLPIETSP